MVQGGWDLGHGRGRPWSFWQATARPLPGFLFASASLDELQMLFLLIVQKVFAWLVRFFVLAIGETEPSCVKALTSWSAIDFGAVGNETNCREKLLEETFGQNS